MASNGLADVDPNLLFSMDIPTGQAPPGVIPNFENPENRTYQLIIVSAVFGGLMLLFMSGRSYIRLRVTRNWGWEDYSALLATVGALVYISMALAIHKTGYGRHSWETYLSALNEQQTQMILFSNSLYGIWIFFAKLSLFLLLLRVFRPLRWLRLLVHIGIVGNALFAIGCFIGFLVYCVPPSGKSWTLYAAYDPKCVQSVKLGYAQSSINSFSDIYLLLIPIPAVAKLQMPLKKKLGVLLIFCTGLVACVASCYGLYARIVLDRNQNDKLWEMTPISMVAVIEITCGVICSSIPAFSTLRSYWKGEHRSFMSILSRRFTRMSRGDSTRGSKDSRGSNGTTDADRRDRKHYNTIAVEHDFSVDVESNAGSMEQPLHNEYALKNLPPMSKRTV